MNDAAFSEWVDKRIRPHCHEKPRYLMLLDSVSVHKSAQSRALLEEFNTELFIIPSGYTAVLQTLDVGMKPFKNYYQELCQTFLVNHPNG